MRIFPGSAKSLLSVLGLLGAGATALAAEPWEVSQERMLSERRYQEAALASHASFQTLLKQLEPQDYCPTPGDDSASDVRRRRCQRTYQRFFKEGEEFTGSGKKGVIDIRFCYGYDNQANPNSPFYKKQVAVDGPLRQRMVKRLLESCPENQPGVTACGFVQDDHNKDLFHRTLRGPDGLLKQVRLRIVHSSVGYVDAENEKTDTQAIQSEYARETFLSGLREADAVFYFGHARDGGGPDFDRPHLANGETDYAWYRKHKPGFKQMLAALKQRKQGELPLLGLFGCDTEDNFSDALQKIAPGTGLITSTRSTRNTENFSAGYAALNALLSRFCEPEFKEQLNHYREKDLSRPPYRIERFFK